MYLVDWKRLVKLLLPTFLRKPVLEAFLQACITPIETIHAEFLEVKKEWDYRLNHDGKVWSLEEVLNDKFDKVKRRITIVDTIFQDDVYVGNRDNREQVYIALAPPVPPEGGEEETMHIGSAPQYYQQADFIVNVPTLVLLMNEVSIRNTVDMYKIAGKTYIIIEI